MTKSEAVATKVREGLKKTLHEAFPEDRLHTPDFNPGSGKKVKITGRSKKLSKHVTVDLDDEFCLVILPRKVALSYGMVDCNNAWDLCVWDPVTGDVRCTSALE